MSLRIQIIIIVAVILSFISIVNMIRKGKLDLKYALPWMIALIGIAIADLFPEGMEAVSKWLGIELPINMLFFIAIVLLLALVFILTVIASKQTLKIKEIAQEVAILRKEIEDHKR